MKTTLLVLSMVAATVLAAAPLTDADWSALREAAIAYPRIIIDDDGCDMTEVPKELPCTREAIYAQMLDYTKGTQVDTISFCPFSVGHRLATRSLVTDVHVAEAALPKNKNLTPELLAMGTDTMQLAVEFCRANNFKVLANLRVNDIHDAWYTKWMYGIKVEHPEQLCGTKDHMPPYGKWTSFDFAQPEVRARVRAICEELLSHYDVDGLELDFYRFPCFFKSAAWGNAVSAEELEAMTQLVRDIRADADRIGKIRRRYLIIVARMPDSAKVAKTMGLDIETWFQEKLIDIYVPGGDGGYYNTYRDAVALAHTYGVRAFPSVDTSWIGGDRSSIAGFQAQSAAALAAGADGLFYFNMFYVPSYIPRMRRELKDLRFERKCYFGYYQRVGNFFPPSAAADDLDELGWRRGTNMTLTAGAASAMEMELGDDFTDPEVQARRPEAKLTVTTDLPSEMPLETAVNGEKLSNADFKDGVFTYSVPTAILKKGANRFDFALTDSVRAFDRVIMKGDKLLKGAIQPPWRRLFFAHEPANAEEIVDGSYRLKDTGTGKGQCENLLYPLGKLTGEYSVSFDLMVEAASAPEAAVLRIADGYHMEVVTFGLGKVGFKYAGKSVDFDTADGFHHYELRVDGDKLAIFADGAEILSGTMSMKADDKAGFLKDHSEAIANMHQQSLLVGSLSAEGTGVSRWKNLTIRTTAVVLKDVELEVNFSEPVDPVIARAIEEKATATRVIFDGTKGAAPGLRKDGVSAKQESFTDGVAVYTTGTAVGGSQYSAYFLEDVPEVEAREGVLVVEWEMEPVELADAMAHCFQMVLQRAAANGTILVPFKFAPGKLFLPWKNQSLSLEPGFNRFRAYLNLANGNAALQINDELAGCGNYGASGGKKPGVFFGDASGYVAGTTRLKTVAIGLVK